MTHGAGAAPARRGDPWTSPEPPVRVARPMLRQAWRDCAFLHWPYQPEALRPHIPRAFELDTHDGRAWLSLISFRMPEIRFGPLPPVPGLASAFESHLRTYVTGPDGRRGIWMLSLDMAPPQAALGGRLLFALPYWWSSMEVVRESRSARYRARRRGPGGARIDLRVEVGEPVPDESLEELDHFLTARWVLYAGAGRVHTAIATEHPRWPLRQATVERVEETVRAALGLGGPAEPAAVHFSDGVDARLSWPRPLRR